MKALKWILLAIIGIPLVLAVAVVVVVSLIDPNTYRQDIEELAQNNAGVRIALNGNIGWSFYPNIGIALEDVILYEAVDSDKTLLSVGEAVLSVRLLPLLSGDVQVDGVVLDSMQANLATDAKGIGNWQSLLGDSDQQVVSEEAKLGQESQQDDAPQSLKGTNISSVTINNSTLRYTDGQTQQAWNLGIVSFTIQDFAADQPVPISAELTVEGSSPQVQANIQLDTQVVINEQLTRFAIDPSVLTVDANNEFLSGEQQIKLSFSGDMDLGKKLFQVPLTIEAEAVIDQLAETPQTVQLKTSVSGNYETLDLRLDSTEILAGVTAPAFLSETQQARVTVDKINASINRESVKVQGGNIEMPFLNAVFQSDVAGFANLDADATVEIHPVDVRKILQTVLVDNSPLEQLLLPVAGEKAFTALSLQSKIEFARDVLSIPRMVIIVDESTDIQADARFNLATNQLDATVTIDQMNVDSYLPPVSETEAKKEPEKQDDTPVRIEDVYSKDDVLPLGLLYAMNADIKVNIGEVTVRQQQLQAVKLTSKNNAGILNTTLNARGLQGSIAVESKISARGERPTISAQTDIKNIDVTGLQAIAGLDAYVAGFANSKATITLAGNSVYDWVHTVNGPVSLSLDKGRLLPLNLSEYICTAIHKASGTTSTVQWPDYTSIEHATVFTSLRDGEATLSNTKVALIDGNGVVGGTVDAPTLDFDLDLGFVVTGNDSVAGCQASKDLQSVTWPVVCRGNLLTTDAVNWCRPDLAKLREQAAQAIKEAAQKEIDKGKQALQKEADKKKKQLQKEADKKTEQLKKEGQKKVDELKDKVQQLFR